MKDKEKTKDELIAELAGARQLVAELQEAEIERRRAEDALRESEDRYRTIFETTGTATVIIEEDTTISLANKEFEKLSGYPKEEVEGKKRWTDFVARKGDLNRMLKYHAARRVDPNAAPRNYEFKFVDKRGATRDIFTTFAVIPGTKRSVGSFLDITERRNNEEALKKSEEQLRSLSSKLMTAQENERKRIAQELHDGIGQILSAIKFGVEDALHQMDQGITAPGAKTLEALIPVVQNGVEEVRRICMDLRPSILDDLGILATISWFCREFQTIYSGVRIEKQIEIEEDDVPELLKIVIYRVTQEALNNIAKHSQADLVRLTLRKKDATVELGIKDNGRGFDLEGAKRSESFRRGLGLASMKERVEHSGGSFSVESLPREGTLIQALWPAP